MKIVVLQTTNLCVTNALSKELLAHWKHAHLNLKLLQLGNKTGFALVVICLPVFQLPCFVRHAPWAQHICRQNQTNGQVSHCSVSEGRISSYLR